MTISSKFECINCGDSSVCDKKNCFHYTKMSNKDIALRDAAVAEKARKEEREKSRKELLKDLQIFIDNADSRIGCPNGTLGIAYLVQWMGGQGWDCD